ncbi:MAG: hypothetical protein HYY09_03940 [Firmicutes bacterium]|nr:hypothetical protein [Bacillota bacterium]
MLVFLVVNFVAVVALALFLTWAGRMQTHSEMLDQRDFPSWLIAATILALVIGFALLLQSQRTKR